jgi:hypothetical protein
MKEVDKFREKTLLLKRIFPTPYAGYEDTLVLFKILRKLGDPYCLKFDEKGYTPTYEKIELDELIRRAVNQISDEDLLKYTQEFNEKLPEYVEFFGRYYTYTPKELKLESKWHELENEAEKLFLKHGNSFVAVLGACWEVNVKLGKRWDNYWMIFSIAKERGLGKGWLVLLADLERAKLIERHKGDIWIPEERTPLVENILEKYRHKG